MTMVIVMMVIVTIVLWMTDGDDIHCEDDFDGSPGDNETMLMIEKNI